jgi:hypothetical protein
MPATDPNFTAADLASIDAAIKSGAKTVRYRDGREVTYQSSAAMWTARAVIYDSLNPQGSATAPVTQVRFVTGTGY